MRNPGKKKNQFISPAYDEYRFEFSELDFMKYLEFSFLEGENKFEAIWK